MKIDKTTFIWDLVVIKKDLIKYNANVIPIKTGSFIEIVLSDNYKEVELCPYQHLINKLKYLACYTRPSIISIID